MSNTYVVGDTARTLRNTLTDGAGVAMNLTGATVKLRWRTGTGSTQEAAAVVVTPASGIVEYTFLAGSFPTAGTYEAEWVVTFSGGTIATVPSETPILLLVRRPL